MSILKIDSSCLNGSFISSIPKVECSAHRYVRFGRVVLLSAAVTVPIFVTKIPVPVAVPAVVMFKPTAISFPVTPKELLPIMMRHDPAGFRVRRSSPITVMPLVMVPHRIPITLYPHKLGAWSSRQNANHAGSGWRANSDPNRDLTGQTDPPVSSIAASNVVLMKLLMVVSTSLVPIDHHSGTGLQYCKKFRAVAENGNSHTSKSFPPGRGFLWVSGSDETRCIVTSEWPSSELRHSSSPTVECANGVYLSDAAKEYAAKNPTIEIQSTVGVYRCRCYVLIKPSGSFVL